MREREWKSVASLFLFVSSCFFFCCCSLPSPSLFPYLSCTVTLCMITAFLCNCHCIVPWRSFLFSFFLWLFCLIDCCFWTNSLPLSFSFAFLFLLSPLPSCRGEKQTMTDCLRCAFALSYVAVCGCVGPCAREREKGVGGGT